MAQRAASPPLAQRRDVTVYLVLDDFGALGRAYRETDAAQAGPKTVVADLLSGQYRHPLRVVAFNTAEGWARDVSADVARQVLTCACGRTTNCQLRCAISWSGRVRENSPEPTPVRCRTAASSAATPAARRLKDTARPHARRGDEPSLMRHGISVA
jgi:hypothetical protein